MTRLRDSLARMAFALALALTAPLAARAEDAAALRRALAETGARNWPAAEAAARASGPLALDIVAWHRLRAGGAAFADYADFAVRNPDWPGMDLLRERAEAAMSEAMPPEAVLAWFGEAAPRTGNGLLRLIAAIETTAGREAAVARLVPLWAGALVTLDAAAETALSATYGHALAEHAAARARALLDRGETAEALKLLPQLTGDDALIARLRADLQNDGPNLNARIEALPPDLLADPGLALDRFRRFARLRDVERAREILLAQSEAAETLIDPALWSSLRADYARAALRAGDPALALRLAWPHHLPSSHPHAVDLDFLAGWAAFQTGDWAAAREHFERLAQDSGSAITQGRALYWQARTAGAAGEAARAEALMRQAATHQSSYYGQLAAEAAGVPMDPALATPGLALDTVPDWRGAAIRSDRRVQAGIWLLVAGEADLAARFLLHVSETADPQDTARLARLMAEFGHTHHALRLSKRAAQRGVIHPAIQFPLTGIEAMPLGIPAELAMAIARQESEFNPRAGSPAGARGLMQVMPATARDIARDVGLPYDLDRLSSDAGYNALYGATYLAGLRARYGPSIALVAAGYNAGPGRSAQWLAAFGDLRRGEADAVDWVESVPFDETRNYVMRVAEALPVYRARIAGKPVEWTPTADITGDGVTTVPLPRLDTTLMASARPIPSPRAAALALAAAAQAPPRIEPAPAVIDPATAPMAFIGPMPPGETRLD
ncbi:transglycosylase SLT domain-containing protein [Paracoccus sp. S-4012]|uniref:lytic transglycosylase domain-containing protein n=1 Tax=Paracoccus sp. S-4012 TaxID=2665648 RepID=UPI0012B01875|nr:lytic transglycosylase domain-containing protein [Paracoccus sp. S-4012]MRX50966.1 transglycosylase SLT domain-containing protein [Paracoccus sp. S-4012]